MGVYDGLEQGTLHGCLCLRGLVLLHDSWIVKAMNSISLMHIAERFHAYVV